MSLLSITKETRHEINTQQPIPMNNKSPLIPCVALLAIANLHSLQARELFKLIRIEDEAAAGTTGTYSAFTSAVINDSNELAFQANLNPASGINNSNNKGIWRDDTMFINAAELSAREDSPAPGAPGAVFTDLINSSSFQLNDDGDLLFRAKLQGAGVTGDNDFGIWYQPGGSSLLTLVAREGDLAPGTDGVFDFVDFPTQSDTPSGEVYFKAILRDGTVTNINNNALYGYIAGTLTLIHREGDATPILPQGAGGPSTPATYGDFTSDPLISSDGKLVFSANIGGVASNFNEVLFIRDGGTTTAIMQEDTPLPDASGTPTAALISRFTASAINGSSEVIMRVGLRFNVGGVTSANNEAIITNAGGSPFRLLAREGSLTPEGGSSFRVFRNIYIGNSGATGLNSQVTPVADSIYSAAPSQPFVNIAKEGIAAPGTDSIYSTLGRAAMNHAGQLLYTSELVNGGSTNNSNNAGLWRTSAVATPPTSDELIARKGDFEDDICGTILAFDLNVPNVDAAGVSGVGSPINDNDNLVVSITAAAPSFGTIQGIYILGDTPPIFCDSPQDELRNVVVGGSVAVSWIEPMVKDDDTVTPPTVVSSHSSGDTFFPGVTIVTYTATDSGGNVSTYRFRVIVTEIRDLNKVLTPDFVARDGDAASASETFNVFSGVCMNDNSDVVFEASTSSRLRGIWHNGGGAPGGSLTAQALTGDNAFGGVNLNQFSDFRILPSGRTAFTVSLKDGGTTSSTDTALLFEINPSSNSLVATEGYDAPDPTGVPSGAIYRQLYEQAVSSSNGLNYSLYPARLRTDIGNATTSNDTGIWFFDADLATGSRLMVREGEPVLSLPGINYGSITQRTVTGGNQTYLFSCRLSGAGVLSATNQAVFADSVTSNSPEILLRGGDVAPGPDPNSDAHSQWKCATNTADKIMRRDTGRFRTFLAEAISPNGENIAIHASLASGGFVNSSNDAGIWAIDTNQIINFIAREGHQAPGFPEGVVFSRFEDIVITDDGGVWFRAYLAHDASLGINSSNDCGIWSTSDGFLRWFIHEGQLAPNTDGALVRRINTFSYDQDGFAATLALVPGTGDALNNNSDVLATGLDSLTGLFQTNIRKGDQFEESPGIFRIFSLMNVVQPFNSAGGSGGYRNAVSGVAEQVVLKTSFTGNGNGVILRNLSDVGP